MRYNPEIHHRRSIRLPGYDYTQPGWYFITIVVQNRETLLGEVKNKKMILNDFGRIVEYHWQKLPLHFKNIELDEYQVMPNHFHGIIHIVRSVDSGENNINVDNKSESKKARGMHSRQNHTTSTKNIRCNASPHRGKSNRPRGTIPGSLGAIMQNYQSITSRKINRIRKTPGARLWQRDFWEHIIRNQSELNRIRTYIRNNPARWEEDNLRKGNIPGDDLPGGSLSGDKRDRDGLVGSGLSGDGRESRGGRRRKGEIDGADQRRKGERYEADQRRKGDAFFKRSSREQQDIAKNASPQRPPSLQPPQPRSSQPTASTQKKTIDKKNREGINHES